MKAAIVSDTQNRVITVRAETEDQALNAANAHLIGQGEAERWRMFGCSLMEAPWPNRRYRIEFMPVRVEESVTYAQRQERWIPA